MSRIINYPLSSAPVSGDVFITDNSSGGTKKLPIENLLDSTLTSEYKPAKGKVVGDRFTAIESQIEDISDEVTATVKDCHNSFATIKESGSYVTFNNAADGTPIKLTAEIHNANSCTIYIYGKNSIIPAVSKTSNGVSFDVLQDGTLHIHGTSTANATIDYNMNLIDGVSYIVSGISGGSSTTYQLFIQSADGLSTFYGSLYNGEKIITKGSGSYNVGKYRIRVLANVTLDTIVYPMVRELGTKSGFEPPSGSSYTISFPNEAGTIANGRLTINDDGTGTLVNLENSETYVFDTPRIKTFLGRNTIFANTGDISVEYKIEPGIVTKEASAGVSNSADTAEQLVSSVFTEEKVPYILRRSGGAAAIGDRVDETVVGGSIFWNQLQKVGVTRTNYGITYTYEDGKLTITGHSDGVYDSYWIANSGQYKQNFYKDHVYLFDVGNDNYVGNASTMFIFVSLANGNSNIMSPTRMLKIVEDSYCSPMQIKIARDYPDDLDFVFYPQVFDLTAMFGATVAEYVYSIEQANEGDGVAWFKKLFPNKFYHYCEPTLMSVNAAARISTGLNMWDEIVISGYWDSNGGNNNNNYLRNANMIRVIPGESYRWITPSRVTTRYIYGYDNNKANFRQLYSPNNNTDLVIPNNVHYIAFAVTKSQYGNAYQNDICFCLSGDRNGEYEPYKEKTYPLDSSLTLMGVPSLDSNNKLYYDGDEYRSDGTVIRRYAAIDMGSLNWTYETSNTRFVCEVPNSKYPKDNAVAADRLLGFMSSYFSPKSDPVIVSNPENRVDRTMCKYSNERYYAFDSAYTDANEFKAAMSGKYLVYELDIPRIEMYDPFKNPQVVDEYGTEEYIDYAYSIGERDVAIPVGHISHYMENLRKKLEKLPWNFQTLIAPTEDTNTATRNYAVGSYLILNNYLYKVTSAIASGATITAGTNVTATTLTEELLALS